MKARNPGIVKLSEDVQIGDYSNLDEIKAKIDTGARTSAIHAFDVQLDESSEQKIVKFKMHFLTRLVVRQKSAFLLIDVLKTLVDPV